MIAEKASDMIKEDWGFPIEPLSYYKPPVYNEHEHTNEIYQDENGTKEDEDDDSAEESYESEEETDRSSSKSKTNETSSNTNTVGERRIMEEISNKWRNIDDW